MSIYNGQTYLREQLDSLAVQEGVVLSLLIRDDGSPDKSSYPIIDEFKEKGVPITLIKGDNIGFALSFSELIKEASLNYADSFDYFAFCDQDDVWLPNKLSAASNALDVEKAASHEKPMMYCSRTTLVDSELKPILSKKERRIIKLSKERSLLQSFATGCTVVMNKAAIRQYANHVTGTLYAHDLMMYQMCMFLGKVIWDSESHILYRQHGHNQIGSGAGLLNRMRQRLEFRKNGGHYEQQAKRLLVAFKDLLTIEDIGIISKFCFYKNSWWSRMALLFDKRYRYNNMESNFFYMIKIIWGGYKLSFSIGMQLAADN